MLSGRLDGWFAAAGGHPALAWSANGTRQDYGAISNGLVLDWNSGRLEGLSARTTPLQRRMYGRATFPLLRKRILAS